MPILEKPLKQLRHAGHGLMIGGICCANARNIASGGSKKIPRGDALQGHCHEMNPRHPMSAIFNQNGKDFGDMFNIFGQHQNSKHWPRTGTKRVAQEVKSLACS